MTEQPAAQPAAALRPARDHVQAWLTVMVTADPVGRIGVGLTGVNAGLGDVRVSCVRCRVEVPTWTGVVRHLRESPQVHVPGDLWADQAQYTASNGPGR